MYTCYQVILIDNQGELPLADYQTEQAAIDFIANNKDKYAGDRLEVRPLTRGF